jgi:hypothetical protein
MNTTQHRASVHPEPSGAADVPDDEAETISEFSADVKAANWAFWAWGALMWTAWWFVIGYLSGLRSY